MAQPKSKSPVPPQPGQQFAGVISRGDWGPIFTDLNQFGGGLSGINKPQPPVFMAARQCYERSVFLKAITQLRLALFNHGFTVSARDKKDAKDGLLKKWLEDNDDIIHQFARDAWQEWLIQSNCIGVWRARGIPTVYPAESASYTDDFGVEQLGITHSLTAQAINAATDWNVEEKKVLTASLANSSQILLTKQRETQLSTIFFFEVVKRTRVGAGLAWPDLRTVFTTVTNWEALELADQQLALAMRTVIEMHKVGHEIKNGNFAGHNTHFLKDKRFKAIQAALKADPKNRAAVARVIQLIVNFDHTVEYPRPDPKHFAASRYDAMLDRLVQFAMPLGQMITGKQINPFHMTFLRAQAAQERDYVGRFIRRVLTKSLKAPVPITVTFSDELFWDPRLMAELMKTALSAGPLSGTTFLKNIGANPELEREQKEHEHSLPLHQIMPPYDPAHGNAPSKPDKGKGGRPGGAPNKGTRQK